MNYQLMRSKFSFLVINILKIEIGMYVYENLGMITNILYISSLVVILYINILTFNIEIDDKKY